VIFGKSLELVILGNFSKRKLRKPACGRSVFALGAFVFGIGFGSLSARGEFVPEVVSIDLHGLRVPDPEFDSQEHRITWQDGRNLWVGDIDSSSGDINFGNAQKIATNCAPMFPMEGTKSHGNGPEWLYSADGAKIFYTLDGYHPAGWAVGVAQEGATAWTAGVLQPFSSDVGGVPEGSRVAGDPDPYFYFYSDSRTKRKAVHIRRLNDPLFKWEIPFETKSPPRFSLDGHELITSTKIGRTFQAVLLRPETNSIEQLTFDKKFHKDELFTWHAPEFGGDEVFMAAECKTPGGDPVQLGIYRKINGEWSRIKTILPPASRKFKKLHSPEPFLFEGRSYVVVSMHTNRGDRDGSEIWIAGIGPENFYRRIAGPEHGIISSDPEAYIGDGSAFIYLAQRGGQQLFRAATGL
jgi:hypothetical protein